MGPPIGSLLFKLGGYYSPFWCVGSAQIILACIGFVLIPQSVENQSEAEKNENSSEISLNFLKNKGFVLVCISASIVFPASYFFAATFSLELLERFSIESTKSGFYAFPIILGRILFSPIFGILIDKGYSIVLFSVIGCSVTTFGYLILTISAIVKNWDYLFIFEMAFFLVGCSSAACIVSFISVNRLVFASEKRYQDTDIRVIDSISSSAASFCFGVGQLISMGIFGGVIYGNLGFHWACFLLACSCLAAGVFVHIYLVTKLKNSETEYLLLK